MLFSTTDFSNPICLEMKLLRSGVGLDSGGSLPLVEIGGSRGGGEGGTSGAGGAMEIGSVDSTDTYASCNTQPFNSQADLTEEDSNLYVNPLLIEPPPEPARNVKKSASGDTALHSLADEEETALTAFPGGPERGSRGSLNETPLPKHRKTRFQQVNITGIKEVTLKVLHIKSVQYNQNTPFFYKKKFHIISLKSSGLKLKRSLCQLWVNCAGAFSSKWPIRKQWREQILHKV